MYCLIELYSYTLRKFKLKDMDHSRMIPLFILIRKFCRGNYITGKEILASVIYRLSSSSHL